MNETQNMNNTETLPALSKDDLHEARIRALKNAGKILTSVLRTLNTKCIPCPRCSHKWFEDFDELAMYNKVNGMLTQIDNVIAKLNEAHRSHEAKKLPS